MNNKKLSIIGILIISVAAFFGFGAIFSHSDTGVGIQALTAAFSALFIILSTNFLMEAQNESSLKREKHSKVFQESLRLYQETATYILKILKDSKITIEEINELRDEYYSRTVLLGSPQTVEKLNDLIIASYDLFAKKDAKNEELENQSINLNDESHIEDSKNLKTLAVHFLMAARESLGLNDYHGKKLVPKTIESSFSRILEQVQKVEQKVKQVRIGLSFEEFSKKNNLSTPQLKKLRDLTNFLDEICKLRTKFTNTQISLYHNEPELSGYKQVIFYLVIKPEKYNFRFAVKSVDVKPETWPKLEVILKDFSPKVERKLSRNKVDYEFMMSLDIEEKQVNEKDLEKLSQAVKVYVEAFKKAQ